MDATLIQVLIIAAGVFVGLLVYNALRGLR